MPRILITGGAGFIGSTLTRELLQKGHEVMILDRKTNPRNLSNIMEDIDYTNGDVRNAGVVESILNRGKPGGIIHLAAVSRVVWGEEDPWRCKDININGTRLLFESIESIDIHPWVIFGSSREVYGQHEILPVKEEYRKAPTNTYGKTKLMGEEIVKEYTKKLGLNASILRFSNVYGNERDILDRVIPRFIVSAMGKKKMEIHGGNQLFDFTHVEDTVIGIIKAIDFLEKRINDPDGFSTDEFHILIGKGSTLQEVVQIISDHLGVNLEISYVGCRDYDVKKFFGDPTKASEILGFKAKILPKKGIPDTIERFREVFDL